MQEAPPCLDAPGIRITVGSQLAFTKARRLRLIRIVTSCLREKRHHIRTLVISSITWAGAFATAPAAALAPLRCGVLHLGSDRALHEAPQAILLEVVGQRCDPMFVRRSFGFIALSCCRGQRALIPECKSS